MLVNFGEQPVDVPLAEPWRVEVVSASSGRRVTTAARRGAAPTGGLISGTRVWRELSAGHRPVVRVADQKGRGRG